MTYCEVHLLAHLSPESSFWSFQGAQIPDIHVAYCYTIPQTPQMRKRLIGAFYIHQTIVLAFRLSEDGLPLPRLA